MILARYKSNTGVVMNRIKGVTIVARFSSVLVAILALGLVQLATAQGIQQTKGNFEDKFRQLEEVLPTPNTYRNAAGGPGHEYWQQEVDYNISATLDEAGLHDYVERGLRADTESNKP